MQVPGGDRDNGYGWISIALHWLTAAAILVLLFAGDSIAVEGGAARNIHTTVGACAWLVLAVRVVWRLWQGHPRPPGVGEISFRIGVVVHYALLLGVVLMLASGPVAGLASGGLEIFGLHVPGVLPAELYGLARPAHIAGVWILGIGTLLHVAGVLKHMFVDRDHTLDRMMVPPARGG